MIGYIRHVSVRASRQRGCHRLGATCCGLARNNAQCNYADARCVAEFTVQEQVRFPFALCVVLFFALLLFAFLIFLLVQTTITEDSSVTIDSNVHLFALPNGTVALIYGSSHGLRSMYATLSAPLTHRSAPLALTAQQCSIHSFLSFCQKLSRCRNTTGRSLMVAASQGPYNGTLTRFDVIQVDNSTTVGIHANVALDYNGMPAIVYGSEHDLGGLRLLRCLTFNCSLSSIYAFPQQNLTHTGVFATIAFNRSAGYPDADYPIIVHYDDLNARLWLERCYSYLCGTRASVMLLEPSLVRFLSFLSAAFHSFSSFSVLRLYLFCVFVC